MVTDSITVYWIKKKHILDMTNYSNKNLLLILRKK